MTEYLRNLTLIVIGVCLYKLWYHIKYLEKLNDLLVHTLEAKNLVDKVAIEQEEWHDDHN
jgi:hypothetical protein